MEGKAAHKLDHAGFQKQGSENTTENTDFCFHVNWIPLTQKEERTWKTVALIFASLRYLIH